MSGFTNIQLALGGGIPPPISLLVAVSRDGSHRVMTSPDGTTWTAQSASSARAWESVCYSPELGLFCAVASDGALAGQVMTSPDGFVWTGHTPSANRPWKGICWSPPLGLFCAVADTFTSNPHIMTSPDGVNWTTRTAPLNFAWTCVIWNSTLGLFIAGTPSGGTNCIMTSPDGVTWTARTTPSSSVINIAAKGSVLFTANDSGGNGLRSTDGINWTGVAVGTNPSRFAIAASPTLFVDTYPGTLVPSYKSSDGNTWTTTNAIINSDFRSMTYSTDLSLFVAVAVANNVGAPGLPRVMTSSDGNTWTGRTAAEANAWSCVCAGLTPA